jgi:deoxyadenosine/deoxycytidine kinase
MHIAVAGNIGSGKTTLTELLAKKFKWNASYEDVESNPYLHSFYEDMQRWSFNLQIYFLNNRFRQIIDIRESGKDVIQDRTIYEDAYIFAPNLHSMNLLSTRDFENYSALFEMISSFIKAPDLLIFLKSSVPNLVNQIQKRGRDYEASIRLDYLKSLNERYEAWISNYKLGKLLIIDVDEVNFAEKPKDLGSVIEKINAELFGLFK